MLFEMYAAWYMVMNQTLIVTDWRRGRKQVEPRLISRWSFNILYETRHRNSITVTPVSENYFFNAKTVLKANFVNTRKRYKIIIHNSDLLLVSNTFHMKESK